MDRSGSAKPKKKVVGSISNNGRGRTSGKRVAEEEYAVRSGALTVRTPQDSPLRFLKDAGVITPEEIPSDDDTIPLDFTKLSNTGIGHLQSRYAVRHAHAIFNTAKLSSDAASIKRSLRLEKAKFRLRNKGEKLNIVNAMMEEDDTITDLENELLEIEAKEKVLDAVAQAYGDIRDAASREITRRSSERAQIS